MKIYLLHKQQYLLTGVASARALLAEGGLNGIQSNELHHDVPLRLVPHIQSPSTRRIDPIKAHFFK